MSIDLAGKIISGSLVLTTTSFGEISIHKVFNPITIGQELQSQENKSLLTESYENWSELIKKYEESKTKGKPKIIDGLDFSSLQTEEKKKEALIKNCLQLWNTSIKEEAQTERIKRRLRNWCLVDPQTLKQ